VRVRGSQRVGKIIQDDRDQEPYKVRFDNGGESHFLKEGEVEKVDLSVRDSANAFAFTELLTALDSVRLASTDVTAAGNRTPKERRAERLQRRSNVQVLFHATSLSNAQNIRRQKCFRPGCGGFLGPGIYFSMSQSAALGYCQCRSGSGPRVVLRCEVNLGNMKMVPRGHCTAQGLLEEGVDSVKEHGRDCYMLPDNSDGQICMRRISIVHVCA